MRPATTEEVGRVLATCSALGVPVVPQGGNTGLVGGSVPAAVASGPLPIVLSTRRLDALGEVDDLSGQVTVGAGATLGDVRRHAADAGWSYGVDLAARDSATIGGTVATNAGGIHVVAYGMTRAQVVGIEAVLPDGSVVSHLSGMLKDNTGYDLGALLCGSEGTLGVITAVRLRLHRPVGRTTVALVGCASYAEAIGLMSSAVAPGIRLLAAEVVDETGLELAAALHGVAWPLAERHPVVTLLEVVDGGDASGLVGLDDADVAVGLDASEQARLWAFREGQGEAFSSLGVCHKLDVSVPLPVAGRVRRGAALRGGGRAGDAHLRGVRAPGGRQHPRRGVRARCRRPGRRPGRAGLRRALRRLHIGRARRGTGQGARPAPVPLGRRDRRHAGPEGRLGPAGADEPGRDLRLSRGWA